MDNNMIYEAILDSISSPVVFVDNDHIIRYLNRSARARYYEKRGYANLVGKSLFDCHNSESRDKIIQIHSRMLAGEDEVFLKVNKDGEKITVVGVREPAGHLIGYYERFEKSNEPNAA